MEFRSDPVDKLPFELLYQVVQHLEVYQIFQAQRVSRKWSQILSSSEIAEPLALKPRFGNPDDSSRTSEDQLSKTLTKTRGFSQGVLHIPDGLSPGSAASLLARHIDSFRNGTALSMAIGGWETKVYGKGGSSQVDFAGSILGLLWYSVRPVNVVDERPFSRYLPLVM